MKVCFLVPDGVGIRNYLYSRLISELPKNTTVLLWHNISENAIAQVRKVHPGVTILEERIPVYVEGFEERLLRESAAYARLNWSARLVNNETILHNWHKSQTTLKRKLLYRVAEVVGTSAKNSYTRIRRLEERYTRLISRDKILAPYINFFQRHKPDLVFCTHQRVPWLAPAIEAAKKLNIRTISAIYSWDNIPKARLPVRTEKFIVWSRFMKEEMNHFYPEIPADDIVVTGTPQFEFYKEQHRIWSREEFIRKFNLNPGKKFICFSGDDAMTSPYDPFYLNDLAEAVNDIREDERPHILFRRCPADFSNRYDEVLKKYSHLITNVEPLWKRDGSSEDWMTFYPLPADVDLLVNLAYHCDMAVNIGSTIAHDFAVYGKPTYYFNYDQINSQGWSVKVVYRLQHFRSMNGYTAVGWINSKNEIKPSVLNVQLKSTEVKDGSRKWLHKILTEDFENSSKHIANFFSEFANNTQSLRHPFPGFSRRQAD